MKLNLNKPLAIAIVLAVVAAAVFALQGLFGFQALVVFLYWRSAFRISADLFHLWKVLWVDSSSLGLVDFGCPSPDLSAVLCYSWVNNIRNIKNRVINEQRHHLAFSLTYARSAIV